MNAMETGTIKLETHLNSITKLCENITNCIASALEIWGESVGQYSGSVISGMSWEYVDLIIKHLRLIRYHIAEIKKHLKTFEYKEDLIQVFVGLQSTIDLLNTIRIKSWFIQYNFSFLIEEIQSECLMILENFSIYDFA